jgi:hypothetical protein
MPVLFGKALAAAIADRGSPAAMTHRGYSRPLPESVATPEA